MLGHTCPQIFQYQHEANSSVHLSECACTWMHVRAHTHTHTHTHTYTLSLPYTHTYTLLHTHIHTHTLSHTHTYTHSLSHTHTYTHSHTHSLSYTHIYMYTHILSLILSLFLSLSLSLSLSHTHTHTHTYTPLGAGWFVETLCRAALHSHVVVTWATTPSLLYFPLVPGWLAHHVVTHLLAPPSPLPSSRLSPNRSRHLLQEGSRLWHRLAPTASRCQPTRGWKGRERGISMRFWGGFGSMVPTKDQALLQF